MQRLVTGLILAVLLWYALGLAHVAPSTALIVAALPLLAALLNLLTAPIFSLSAIAAIGIIGYVMVLDEGTKADLAAEYHRALAGLRQITEPRQPDPR